MSQTLYKFRDIDKFAFDILANKRLYLSHWTKLNDPHEGQMYIISHGICANNSQLENLEKHFKRDFINDNIRNPRICSLSSTCTSNLLWSHYTTGHNGIAIGVVLPTLDDDIDTLNIKYDNKIPEIEKYPIQKKDVLEALTHKSKEWKYEKEVRLITFDSGKNYIENIEIKEMVFGLQPSNDDINLISKFLKNDNVEYCKMDRDYVSYNITKSKLFL